MSDNKLKVEVDTNVQGTVLIYETQQEVCCNCNKKTAESEGLCKQCWIDIVESVGGCAIAGYI